LRHTRTGLDSPNLVDELIRNGATEPVVGTLREIRETAQPIEVA
tara:strand:- start:450 stop:581 length:132 start_codon:yes stop_codon:yes gene_type:complete